MHRRRLGRGMSQTNNLPDRLSLDPRSPHFDSDVLRGRGADSCKRQRPDADARRIDPFAKCFVRAGRVDDKNLW